MNRPILYFLSRFSVKVKVAFMILFLIGGIIFWNLSYITSNYNAYTTKVENLEAMHKVRKIEQFITALQHERRAALNYLYVTHDKAAFVKAVKT